MKGMHGQHLLTFMLQARVNRLTSYENIHRFHPTILTSPACPHCPGTIDSVAHRLIECPHRLDLAQNIRHTLAHRLAKGSNHPWSGIPPPDTPNLKALLHAYWPNSIQMRTAEQPAKNPLNEGRNYDEHDGLLICTNDDALDGTVDIQFFKDRNPITKAEIEAKKFPDFPGKKDCHFERITQIHVLEQSPDRINPTPARILSLRAFSSLWHKYSTIHGNSQQSADFFHRDLVTLLAQEEEGAKRENVNHTQRAKTSWTTPASLMEILVKTFGLTYERYCSPLNFCPIFKYGSTIGNHLTNDNSGLRVNSRFGFDHDAKLQDWVPQFGYSNCEWHDDDIVECINRSESAAASTSTSPVRNMSLLPYNKSFPKAEARLNEPSLYKRVLIVFSPNTFAFTPYQVINGTRSDFGAKAYDNSVALVSWENRLAPPPTDSDLAMLGRWCAENLLKPNKQGSDDRPQWSRHIEAAVTGYAAPELAPPPPIHPSWHDLACSLTPTDDYATLLQTASGIIPKATKDIFTASHSNPAKCAAELQRLTLDTIQLFQSAWQQSHDITPHVVFQKDNLAPEQIFGDFEQEEGEDPDPECNPKPNIPTPPAHPHPATRMLKPTKSPTTHTSTTFTKPTLLNTNTTPLHEFSTIKPRTHAMLVRTLTKALEYDAPLVRARLNPTLGITCPHCNERPAVRTFPDHSNNNVPSCAQCRTAYETKETYGQFNAYSPHCSRCGSHQHRNSRAMHHTGFDASLKGWALHHNQRLCLVCVKDTRSYQRACLPPTNFPVATCKNIVRSNKCLICLSTDHPKQSLGKFLHHAICPSHYRQAPTAHVLTTARTWQYLNARFKPLESNTHNIRTIANWVAHYMATSPHLPQSC